MPLLLYRGLAISSSVAYIPCERIAGNTSLVTHRLNFLACGNLLDSMREYNPLSLIQVTFRFWPAVTICSVSLSSLSIWSRIAFLAFWYPNISATSLPTKYGLLSISTVLIFPNKNSYQFWFDKSYPVGYNRYAQDTNGTYRLKKIYCHPVQYEYIRTPQTLICNLLWIRKWLHCGMKIYNEQ